MPGWGGIGFAPVGAGGAAPFALRVRAWRAAAVFDKGLALTAVFDKAAAVSVTAHTEE